MLRYMVITLSLVGIASSIQPQSSHEYISAASESQIRFAEENKYDDTGPGAKQPEYAYQTYKTLEEALVGYLDDPDTKLPEHERQKVIQHLDTPTPYYQKQKPERYWPHIIEEYEGFKRRPEQQFLGYKQIFPEKKPYYQLQKVQTDFRVNGNEPIYRNFQNEKILEPLRYQKFQSVKESPLNLAHYTRDPYLTEAQDQFNPHPKYTYSYGVHDKHTGDTKSAHETRDGSAVRGYYSFLDPDGKQRVVHYQADDKLGFRATVQRSDAHE